MNYRMTLLNLSCKYFRATESLEVNESRQLVMEVTSPPQLRSLRHFYRHGTIQDGTR